MKRKGTSPILLLPDDVLPLLIAHSVSNVKEMQNMYVALRTSGYDKELMQNSFLWGQQIIAKSEVITSWDETQKFFCCYLPTIQSKGDIRSALIQACKCKHPFSLEWLLQKEKPIFTHSEKWLLSNWAIEGKSVQCLHILLKYDCFDLDGLAINDIINSIIQMKDGMDLLRFCVEEKKMCSEKSLYCAMRSAQHAGYMNMALYLAKHLKRDLPPLHIPKVPNLKLYYFISPSF